MLMKNRLPIDVALDKIRMNAYQRIVPPEDVTVRTIPLPPHVHGFVIPDPDAHFNVYLNSRDSYYKRMETLQHELDHIARGDAWTPAPLDVIDSFI